MLRELQADDFQICVLRPPMIYGPNSVGNYPRLAKLAKKTPIFPKVNNQRSMLYIGNLSAFLKLMIDTTLSGTFHPQNKEYVNTSEMVKLIAKTNRKKLYLVPGFSGIITVFSSQVSTLRKVFGTLVYDDKTQGFPGSTCNNKLMTYQNKNFDDSILETEL